MIYEMTGNVLDVEEGIIAHQVNCMGVMGAGIAREIKHKFPEVFERYASYCSTLEYKSEDLLGYTQLVETEKKNLLVANVFGQARTGIDRRQTSYDATYNAWSDLFSKASFIGYPIYIPYLMGCGLGGGNWQIYTAIIDSFKSDIPVTVVKLPEVES